jgi:predicted phosphodiesterase
MKKLVLILILCLYYISADAIQQIRWGSTGNPLNGLCITWRSTGNSDSILWGYTTSFEMGSFSAVMRNGYSNHFFSYNFGQPLPNAMIYYKLYDSDSNSWTPAYSYKTAPPSASQAFSFLAMADSRDGMAVWTQITNLANSKKADFTIFTGDIITDATDNSQWDAWFNSSALFLQNNTVYFCEGNHEASDTAKFQNNFIMPEVAGSRLYYSFTYGDAIFICLNTEQITADEYNWLLSELQVNQSKKWKVVYFHRPFFSIGPHAGEMNSYLSSWWTAFDTYGVDLIINGHDHMYERSKPLNYSVSPSAPVSTYGSGPGQGRCEIVCGGAGAPLYTGTASWFVETYQSNYNFCKFNINGDILTDSTFDFNGNLVESFFIDKSASAFASLNQHFNPISLYPNPSINEVTVKYKARACGEIHLNIIDINGKTMLSQKAEKTREVFEYHLDISALNKGTYTVQLSMGSQKDNALLIVK